MYKCQWTTVVSLVEQKLVCTSLGSHYVDLSYPTRRLYVMSHTCVEVTCNYSSTIQLHTWGQRIAVITYLGGKFTTFCLFSLQTLSNRNLTERNIKIIRQDQFNLDSNLITRLWVKSHNNFILRPSPGSLRMRLATQWMELYGRGMVQDIAEPLQHSFGTQSSMSSLYGRF